MEAEASCSWSNPKAAAGQASQAATSFLPSTTSP